MKLAVIGTGYVGLVAGACFADMGNHVCCIDRDARKVDLLRSGGVPIYEPGLDDLVARNIAKERLTFTTDAAAGLEGAEVVFIAVGTPPGEDGSADLSHVLAVSEVIAQHITEYTVVVCKSTVPVGTCDRVRDLIRSKTDVRVDVVSNPEFLKEGAALADFQSPDRVVIGGDCDEAVEKVASLYTPFLRRSERILRMDLRSAEMTKYASNSMLATKISFINEIANLCDRVGADVNMVRKGMSMDERIGPHFIYPGVGYGGSCFPKDVRALTYLGHEYDRELLLLSAVEAVNNRQKERLLDFALGFFGGDLSGKKFAMWGLSFKPNTDDVREASALATIRRLLDAGATVVAHDPVAADNALEYLGSPEGLTIVKREYDALDGADGLFLMTEWNDYRSPDFTRIKASLNTPVIFDGRNLFSPSHLKGLGITYFCIGRATVERAW